MKGKTLSVFSIIVSAVGGGCCRKEGAELPVRKSHLNQIQPSGNK